MESTPAIPVPRTSARPPATSGTRRLSGRALVMLAALMALIVIYATDQVAPATSDRQAQLRLWLMARSTGIVAYLLLTTQVVLGLVLSHQTNKSTWKLSKQLFPWHEQLWIFIVAFVGVHVVSIALDSYAHVGPIGALVPGASEYRSLPVAIGTTALYALLITGITGRYTRLLPPGGWLVIHRLSLAVVVLAWLHGVLAGSDSGALEPMYAATGLAVVAAAAYRYWVVRRSRTTATPQEVRA